MLCVLGISTSIVKSDYHIFCVWVKKGEKVIQVIIFLLINNCYTITKVHVSYGIPLIFFFLFTSISSSIGLIMVPSFVTRGGFISVRCAVSGIHVFPIGARILASKSFTLVKGNGNSLT